MDSTTKQKLDAEWRHKMDSVVGALAHLASPIVGLECAICGERRPARLMSRHGLWICVDPWCVQQVDSDPSGVA
jgi:hypothetical protein